MSSDLEFGGIVDGPAVAHAARLVNLAFAGPIEKSEEWLRLTGLEHVRALGERGRPPGASLLRVPMGQHFGGRSVPMVGIAGVAVAPESRGKGLARELMRRALTEIAAEGVPLSGLYASTQDLYRQVGYEQAGHRFEIRIPLHRIGVRERASEVRPLEEEDLSAVRACYEEFAGLFNGTLDRGPYCWGRVRELRGERYSGFGFFGAGGLEGYLFLKQARKPESGRHDVLISDAAFRTPGAGRRMLGFLADFATTGDEAVLYGGPLHPLLSLMPQQHFDVRKRDYWMLRIVSVKGAIEGRGYSGSVGARFTLRVTDGLIAENEGAWDVHINGGRARVERGAPGGSEVRVGVNGLAAVYSGLYTAREAAVAGLVEGDGAGLDAMGAAFAGGTPWMSDMF